jgi:hypothetical protein
MKSIVEQVDEFMEGLADGSILFFNAFSPQQQPDHTWVTAMDTRSQELADIHVQILNDNIPLYLSLNNKKEELAFKIHYSMLMLRSLGVIMNNPDALKELHFFKSRCEKLETEKQKLEARVSDLSTKILGMTSPPDPKVGTH